jgi:hypothetical protein
MVWYINFRHPNGGRCRQTGALAGPVGGGITQRALHERGVFGPYDNALAETINGLYKTELIKPGKP